MMIWRRKGWLIPVIFFVMLIVTQVTINFVMGDEYYQLHEWPKGMAVGLAATLIAIFGYLVNYKYREIFVDEEAGTSKKASSHTLFFIPVEYWAIIIPVFLIWMNNYSEQKDLEELAYINAPEINDMYLIDITRTRTEMKDDYKYGIFKVVNVQSDGVDIVEGGYVFESKKGVRKEVKKSKINGEDYFDKESYFMDTQSLITLKNNGDIFKVRRSL